jgi:hypothetical protein
MTSDGFRKLALALPESRESSHQDHPDFRVGKRVFATLHPKIFVPVKSGWGARGATNVNLKAANRAAVWPALVQAWRNASD